MMLTYFLHKTGLACAFYGPTNALSANDNFIYPLLYIEARMLNIVNLFMG